MDHINDFDKVRVLITGGRRGLGAAIGDAFETRGATVDRLSTSEVDLSDPEQVANYLSSNHFVVPDVLILNAAINNPHEIVEGLMGRINETMQVNFTSQAEILSKVFPEMLKRKGGKILSISSLYSQRSRTGRAAYSTSKAAMDALIRTCAIEGAANGVLANSVSPGFIENALTRKNNDDAAIAALAQRIPMNRLAQEHELMDIILLLCSSRNTYITGQNIAVDGGYGLV